MTETMHDFTPLASSIGGLLIGLAASILLIFNGRIAGISGITSGLLFPSDRGEIPWRLAFVGGLGVGGLVMAFLFPHLFAATTDRSLPLIAIAGLVVGVGVRFGSGCTSGHGVCGLSRLSPRSLVATLTFIATGAITVAMVRFLGGPS